MDIVEKLRKRRIPIQYGDGWTDYEDDIECHEAADEIEKLREALRVIGYGPPHEGEPRELLNQFVDLARAALKDGE